MVRSFWMIESQDQLRRFYSFGLKLVLKFLGMSDISLGRLESTSKAQKYQPLLQWKVDDFFGSRYKRANSIKRRRVL